jgi:hypothetical protein
MYFIAERRIGPEEAAAKSRNLYKMPYVGGIGYEDIQSA